MKKIKSELKKRVVFLLGLFFLSIVLLSTPFIFILRAGGNDDTETLIVGETKIFAVNKPTRVMIGNPVIADIGEVTNSEITVTAKAPGLTPLVYWDIYGEQTISLRVIGEDMNETKRRIDNILKKLNFNEVYTKANNDEGKVIILGRVKAKEDGEKITSALASFKSKILDLTDVKEDQSLIEIDVQVLELNKDGTKELGLIWPGGVNILETGSPALQQSGTVFSALFRTLNFRRAVFDSSDGTSIIDPFVFKLNLLVKEGKARILSRPRLSCQSGKQAQLLVGGEKPILTTSVVAGGGSANDVQYKEFGIKLKINPSVTEQDRIKLSLYVEVSDVGDAETLGDPTKPSAKAYPLSKRTASTELYVDNGQTTAIGGLVKQKTEEDLRKVPWLADIPVLGMFFRDRITKTGKGAGARDDSELFITLTPTIVSREMPSAPAASLNKAAVKTEYFSATNKVPQNLVNYVKAVQQKIHRAAKYPLQAKNADWEGIVKLSLNIAANGALKEVKVAKSSGYIVLDEAAVELAQEQEPYPPFPPKVESQELWVDVPVVYKKN